MWKTLVKTAKNNSKYSPLRPVENTVQKNARDYLGLEKTVLTGMVAKPLIKMDMYSSLEKTTLTAILMDTSESIGLLWKHLLVGIYAEKKLFTTSMEIVRIIELKILNYFQNISSTLRKNANINTSGKERPLTLFVKNVGVQLFTQQNFVINATTIKGI